MKLSNNQSVMEKTEQLKQMAYKSYIAIDIYLFQI